MSEPPIDDLIVSELHIALRNLGGSPDDDLRSALEVADAIMAWNPPTELRSIIGSIGDTLSDEEILKLLREYNTTGKVMHERH